MTDLVGYLCIAVAAGLGLLIVADEAKGRVPLFSLRNFFLGGFVIFQLLSGAHALLNAQIDRFVVSDLDAVAPVYFVLVLVFLGCFFFAYHRRSPVDRVGDKVPRPRGTPSPFSLMGFAVVLTVLGIGLQFVPIPYVGVLSRMTGVGVSASAAGVAAWIWAPRLFNPVYAAFAVAVIGINWVMVSEGYGRRDELTVLLAVGWAFYYSHFRFIAAYRYLVPLAGFALVVAIMMGMVTSVRGQTRDMGAVDKVQHVLTQGDPMRIIDDVSSGQGAAQISMWVMETRPDLYPYTPFRTIKYFFEFPIPREIYREKPLSLGQDVVREANVRNVVRVGADGKSGLNVGPGMIGQSYADGHVFFAALHGLLYGLLLRFFDRLLSRGRGSILLIVPAAAALGQVLGIPRGGAASMTFIFVYTTVSTYAICWALGWLFRFPPEQSDLVPADDDGYHPSSEPELLTEPGSSTREDQNWAAMAG